MKDVRLNQKAQARISALNSVLEYQVSITDAAELLVVTHRHAGSRQLGPPSPQCHFARGGCRSSGTGDGAIRGHQAHLPH